MSSSDPGRRPERTALVTGAGGGGIGSRCALRLAGDFRVLLNGTGSSAGELEALYRRIRLAGGTAETVVADVSDEAQLRAALEPLGPVDAVVHNAAPSEPHRPVQELTAADWAADLGPILGGAANLVSACAPGMIDRSWGRLVFVSSSAAFRGSWGRSASYAAAKAALHGLVAQAALELGPHGITVNAVAPSQVATPRSRRGGRRDDASLARQAEQVPVRRVGQPDEIASLITYLCSDPAGYLTGQAIRVDGGSSLAAASTRTRTPRTDP